MTYESKVMESMSLMAKRLLEEHGSFYRASAHSENLFFRALQAWQENICSYKFYYIESYRVSYALRLEDSYAELMRCWFLLKQTIDQSEAQKLVCLSSFPEFAARLTALALNPAAHVASLSGSSLEEARQIMVNEPITIEKLYLTDFVETVRDIHSLFVRSFHYGTRHDTYDRELELYSNLTDRLSKLHKTGALELSQELQHRTAVMLSDFDAKLSHSDAKIVAESKLNQIYQDALLILNNSEYQNIFDGYMSLNGFRRLAESKALESYELADLKSHHLTYYTEASTFSLFLDELQTMAQPLVPRHEALHKGLRELQRHLRTVPSNKLINAVYAKADELLHDVLFAEDPLPLYQEALDQFLNYRARSKSKRYNWRAMEAMHQELETSLVLASIDG